MNTRNGILGALGVAAAIAVIVLASSAYTVSEIERVVITRFGEPVPGSEKTPPGLHFKTPFIDKVNRIEKRVLAWDGLPQSMPTKDKRMLHVDSFARWKVRDPLAFLRSLGGNTDRGQKKLDDLIDAAVRDVVGTYDLIELVRTSNRELAYESEELAAEQRARAEAEKVSVGRAEMVKQILRGAKARLDESLGIEIIDVRIKRVIYVNKVLPSIYARMRSERERIAARYLSEAQEQARKIIGQMNKELRTIVGETEEVAAKTRGEADAAAIKIYGDAIAQTGDFYEFLRTLEAYKVSIDSRTTLLLSTESDFLRFLKRIDAPKEK